MSLKYGLLAIGCFLLAGCAAESTPTAVAQTNSGKSVADQDADASAQNDADDPTNAPAPEDEAGLPPNLGTRKKGVDWPAFLGPTGDSKSPEKGLLTPWPKDGLKILWQRPLRESYGIG